MSKPRSDLDDPFGDPFGLLDPANQIEPFVYTNKQWAEIKAVVRRRRLAEDPDNVSFKFWPPDPVTLRQALELALWAHAINLALRARFPTRTRTQIRTDAIEAGSLARRFSSVLRGAPIAAYGPDSRALQAALENWQRRLVALVAAIDSGTALPGPVAPKDAPIAQGHGWQWMYRDHFSLDPQLKLIGYTRQIYSLAFQKPPGVSDDGPAAEFIRAAVQPVAPGLGSIRRILEKCAEAETHQQIIAWYKRC